jgi:hypothetical protein
MDFVPSSLANPSTLVGSTLSGVTIVASTASGTTIIGGTISGSTLVGVTLTGSTFIGGTLSGTSLVSVTVNSGSTISVYALPTAQFVHVNRSGSDQTGVDHAVATQINYTNEVFDAAGVYSLGDDKMTPTIAGKYLCIGVTSFISLATGDFFSSMIYKNGSQVARADASVNNTDNVSAVCIAIVDMNGTTDYLEHYCRQANLATTDRDLYGSTDKTYFMAMRLST